MKHSKIILTIGIWFLIIPLLGIPLSVKKFLLVIPALLLIAMAITAIRNERDDFPNISSDHEELIHEVAEDIADDIINHADEVTTHEMKKLRDIL